MTMCDIALGYRTTRSQTPSPMLTTASVTTDFAGGAKVGDWVEAHVDVQKVGGRLAFANCDLICNGERIVHATSVFARSDVYGASRPGQLDDSLAMSPAARLSSAAELHTRRAIA